MSAPEATLAQDFADQVRDDGDKALAIVKVLHCYVMQDHDEYAEVPVMIEEIKRRLTALVSLASEKAASEEGGAS